LGRKKVFSGQGQVRSKDGEIIADEEEQQKRWLEYFQEVLNREEPQHTPLFREPSAWLDVDIAPFGSGEIEVAIRRMKNGKAAGCNGVTAVIIKAGGEGCMSILRKLF
jgi:hypothetical protein